MFCVPLSQSKLPYNQPFILLIFGTNKTWKWASFNLIKSSRKQATPFQIASTANYNLIDQSTYLDGDGSNNSFTSLCVCVLMLWLLNACTLIRRIITVGTTGALATGTSTAGLTIIKVQGDLCCKAGQQVLPTPNALTVSQSSKVISILM